MMQPFYLVSISCGNPIAVRECVYLRTLRARPTNRLMHLVSISPPFEGLDYRGLRYFTDTLLLMTVNDEWSLEDTIAEEYMIDVYTSALIPEPGYELIDVADIERLEMGTLFATREKAEERLAQDLKPWDTRD
ncbi:MAG: hypothetical protein JJU33_08600 [Phycisphaerales bacterium]|nr:hypothetical protein [Phycisphaerales bacterium]